MSEPIQVPTQITNFGVGDLLCGSAPGRSARLPGNTSAAVKVLAEKGDGKTSAFPFWEDISSVIPSLAAIATSGSASDLVSGTIPPLRFPGLVGDVTNPVGSLVTTISQGAVGNSKLGKFPPLTVLGNSSILSAYPQYLTVSDLASMGVGGSGGGGGGSGTVTSVGLSVPPIFNIAGSPVTTVGAFNVTLATELANTAWMGPAAGVPATPTFRGLAIADIPSLSTLYQPLNAKLTAFSGLANALGFLHNDGAGVLAWTAAGGGTGDFVGPTSATDNAVVRFDGTTGKLGQNSLFIIDDSGNVSDGGTLPASTSLYFERSSFCIATLNSTGQDARLRLIRADNTKSAWLEFIRNDNGTEWLMGAPWNGTTPSGTEFTIDYWDGSVEHPWLLLSTAGALRLPAYGVGTLQTDASGNVTAGSVSSTPAGSNTQIQFNNSGVFGASSGLTWDNTNSTIRIGVNGLTPRDPTVTRAFFGGAANDVTLEWSSNFAFADSGLADWSFTNRGVTSGGSRVALWQVLTGVSDANTGQIAIGVKKNASDSDVTTVINIFNTGLLKFGAYGAGYLKTDSSGNVTSSTLPSTGDFYGPSSATDNAVIRFDGITGKLGQNSAVVIDDGGVLSIGGRLQVLGSAVPASRGGMEWAYDPTGDSGSGWGSLELYAPATTNLRTLLLSVNKFWVRTGANTGYASTSAFEVSSAGLIKLPLYTTAGLLSNDASGNVTTAIAGTGYVAPGSITIDGITMSTARLLGRTTAATGAVEELTAGTSLSLSSGTLNTIQDIRTTVAPSFAGLTLTGDLTAPANALYSSRMVTTNNSANAMGTIGNSSNSVGMFIQNTVTGGHLYGFYSSGGGPGPLGSFVLYDSTDGAARLTIAPTSGATTVSSSIQTGNPSGGTALPFKSGSYVGGAPAATGYIQFEVNGTAYKLLCST